MDTKSNQKTRRFTKLAWCKKWGENPRKKVSSRSKKAGEVRPESAACSDVKKVEVNPQAGAWLFAVAILIAAILVNL